MEKEGRQIFGLLGSNLSHSFSKKYFEEKFCAADLNDCKYRNYELANLHGFPALLKSEPNLRGLNVTYPYKEAIIEYLDELSNEAREIGAVNCIKIKNGKTTGYNTDVYGFQQSIKPFLDSNHTQALILGTGGGAKAVAFVLSNFGIGLFYATSDPAKISDTVLPYSAINEHVMNACKLIVNCTPLGMYPQTERFPDIPYQCIRSEHLAYDLIYNPPETIFLQKAREAGAATVNGLSMLQLQAEKSWDIWTEKEQT